MNRFVVRSVVARDRRNFFNRRASTTAVVVPRRFEESETMMMMRNRGGAGGCGWLRAMALDVATVTSQSESSSIGKEKEKEKKEKSLVKSSYWGVQRPRVTREDGTEWPWNCFMVRIRFHSQEFLVHFMKLNDLSMLIKCLTNLINES